MIINTIFLNVFLLDIYIWKFFGCIIGQINCLVQYKTTKIQLYFDSRPLCKTSLADSKHRLHNIFECFGRTSVFSEFSGIKSCAMLPNFHAFHNMTALHNIMFITLIGDVTPIFPLRKSRAKYLFLYSRICKLFPA